LRSEEMKKYLSIASAYLRCHIDISTFVVAVLVLSFLWRPLYVYITTFVGVAATAMPPMPTWVENLLQNILANIVSAAIIIPPFFWILRVREKSAAAGRFNAFVTTQGVEEAWGEVRLSYNLLSNRIKGNIRHGEVIIDIEAQFDRSQYLRGHYIDRSNAARRRLGAFLYLLSGDSDTYSGPFVYVDPDDNNNTPRNGTVKWVRVKA
jgi:hypothetical protein